ncbi:SRPBCC family protein [Nocardioides insulae]|uniref:SRPBCC family protein n=1 Tax=Nocardioides insulae TaxID=394734 RepID=UPI0004201769|nr:SRPBCC family protein [Nocardioides insulae]
MELTHEFSVPGSVEETWERFLDIGSLAECFPGAQVTSVEDDSFQGTVKVKLGPIALVYNGSGTFTEKDESARRMVVEAKGKDKRGNGTAGATVTVELADGSEETRVSVHTDLAITGKPAQFGRGVLQDVSDKLLGQFVACLAERAESGGETAAEPAPVPVAGAAGAGGPVDGTAESAGQGTADEANTGATTSVEPPLRSAGPAEAQPPRPQHRAPEPEALDLGATVLPVLIKTYAKPAAAALGALVVVWWVSRRIRRRSA